MQRAGRRRTLRDFTEYVTSDYFHADPLWDQMPKAVSVVGSMRDDEAPLIRGTDRIATQLNFGTVAQADREWFHHPARRPTTLDPADLSSGPLRPLGREVLRPYGRDEAIASQRRVDAAKNLTQMIEDRNGGELRVVRVEARGSTPSFT
jgi:hypothetical protein